MKLGRDNGNSRAVVRWGRYLDKGIWITHPNLRQWKFRSELGYYRLWFLDVHL